jgi:uncharacterized membrane protein
MMRETDSEGAPTAASRGARFRAFARVARLPWPMIVVLALGGVGGGAAIFWLPPNITWDAPAHYYRTGALCAGEIRAVRFSDLHYGSEPAAREVRYVESLWSRYWNDHDIMNRREWLRWERRTAPYEGQERVHFSNIAIYSPLNHGPQVLGRAAARLVTDSPLAIHHTACAVNLAVYLGLVLVGLHLLPRFRWGVALFSTSPFLVAQAATMNTDALNYAAPLLFLAYIWRARDDRRTGRRRDWIVLVSASVVLPLLKPTLLPVLSLMLLLRKEFFGSLRGKWIVTGGLGALAGALWMYWNLPYVGLDIARSVFPDRPPMEEFRAWTLSHPGAMVRGFVRFYTRELVMHWDGFYGGFGAWLNSSAFFRLRALAPWFALAVLLCSAGVGRPDWAWAGALLVLAFVNITLTAVPIWFTFGRPGMETIEGVTGRYFFLAYALIAAALAEVSRRWIGRVQPFGVVLGLALNATGLTTVIYLTAQRTGL